mmetsp:Transcript_32458/g.49664  ORF Transcript_32458/g.49664 Transcript_32458/m.49664 type:complete len:86 (+) Transcript_32458:666-923(+)
MCMAHCELVIQSKKNGQQKLMNYHCREEECSQAFKRAQCKVCGMICMFVCLGFIIMMGLGAAGGDSSSSYSSYSSYNSYYSNYYY